MRGAASYCAGTVWGTAAAVVATGAAVGRPLVSADKAWTTVNALSTSSDVMNRRGEFVSDF